MKQYESISLIENFVITKIYSIHYFEYAKDFGYAGESHDFWELLCVDSGEIYVTAGNKELILQQGEMIFHKPNEFHALRANGKTAPNLMVVSFECDAECMEFFRNRVVSINPTERFYLGQIITEAKKTFDTPLNNPYICKLERKKYHPFGSEQIIKISLESMLISILRRYSNDSPLFRYEDTRYIFRHKNDDIFIEQVIQYLNQNITEKLTVSKICKDNMIGRSQLQKIFHQEKNCGVMEYFSYLKVNMAKKLIRENRYNYQQIANMLSYSSYQYFSLSFKKHTSMTPSEYYNSIKSFSD